MGSICEYEQLEIRVTTEQAQVGSAADRDSGL